MNSNCPQNTDITQDAFAILLSAQCPALRLLGISTIYGNAPLEKTTQNTRSILRAIGREDVPVYAGASKPFCRPAASAPDIHGESGLGMLLPDSMVCRLF
jgi:uridine nucleosidase